MKAIAKSFLSLIMIIMFSPLKVDAQLKVVGRFLQDANGNNVMLRGVNVDVYKEGYVYDIDAVSNAVANTKANVVRIAWWTHNPSSPEPQTGTTYNTVAFLDSAITKFANRDILPIVMLHDLTGQADSNQFKNIITSYWISSAMLIMINKHKNHLIINIANEWGPNYNTNGGTDSQTDINYFIKTYLSTIKNLRAAGITVPLLIDADQYADNEKIFTSTSFGQGVSNGQYLINNDPLGNLMFGVHTYYWTYQNADPTTRLNAVVNSKLPIIIGEEGNLLPDGSVVTNYGNLLAKANADSIGYMAWSWYNDGTGDQTGTAPFWMNMTIGTTQNGSPGGTGDGVTIPTTAAQNAWGYAMLNAANYGINATNTQKINFTSTVLPLTLTNFTATAAIGFNLITWQTTNEVNTRIFEIDYSTDGINFKTAGILNANNTENYSFKHIINSLDTTLFYRLKIIDVDGSFIFSNIIKLNNKNFIDDGLKLSPNPANNATTLTGIDYDLINTQLKLMDNNGKTIKQFLIDNYKMLIDLSPYSKGIYILQFTNGKTLKILKQ